MKFFVSFSIFAFIYVSAFAEGHVTYTLHKSSNPSADEQEAYQLITVAMDSALYYYNKYTDLSKYINVYYSTGVPTAEASSNGDLRFGKDRNYMYVGTAMHEIAHTMGMGTTTEYKNMFNNGVFLGNKAQTLLKELDGFDAELHGDSQHFWPYGINYRSEVKSEKDLINHAKIVNAMYQDIFKEAFYKNVRIALPDAKKCMGRTEKNTLEMMDCTKEGTQVKLYSIGDNPVTYRIEFGDRVVDIPNESTAAGVVASTYGWNGGAHQRYTFEETQGLNTPNATAVYLKNYKSKLYLEATDNQIVQNNNKFTWLLIENYENNESIEDTTQITPELPKDSSKTDSTYNLEKKDSTTTFVRSIVKNTSLQNRNHSTFDIKGRNHSQNARIARWNILFKKP